MVLFLRPFKGKVQFWYCLEADFDLYSAMVSIMKRSYCLDIESIVTWKLALLTLHSLLCFYIVIQLSLIFVPPVRLLLTGLNSRVVLVFRPFPKSSFDIAISWSLSWSSFNYEGVILLEYTYYLKSQKLGITSLLFGLHWYFYVFITRWSLINRQPVGLLLTGFNSKMALFLIFLCCNEVVFILWWL